MSGKAPKSRDRRAPAKTDDSRVHAPSHLPHFLDGFLHKLKRRNVGRVAILYIVVCYLILEPFEMFFHLLDLPAWTGRTVVLLMVLGFPAALLFAWIYEITPEGIKPSVEVDPRQSISRQTGRKLDRAIIAMLAVALTYFVIDKFWLSKHAMPQQKESAPHETAARAPAAASTEAAATEAAFAPPPHSIAVLPFLNLSGDKEQEYFSDGLTEELLNSLTEISELQVAARTSAFSFKGTNTDIGTIARKLNVGAILEGSVRRSAHTIRITAQLINAVTGFHLWSKTYDRNLGDVLRLQTEIATAVASALKVTLLSGVSARIELGGTHNPAAFDAYLRGAKAHSAIHDAKDLATAIAAYTEALRLDPHYALSFAARSMALSDYTAEVATGASTREGFDKAQADARQALELAPGLAEAHLASGLISEYAPDFAQASDSYERALALAPGNAVVLRQSGVFAVLMGHIDAGLAALRRAVVLDPLARVSHSALGQSLYLSRRYEEAVAAFAEVISLEPEYKTTYGRRGLAYYGLGDLQSARASCETKPEHWVSLQCLAVIHHKLGRHTDAEAALAKLKASQGDNAAYQYATIYAQWGNSPKALEWLDAAVRLHDTGLEILKTDPLLDPIRQEPRFQAVMRELKFPN
jgi:adenylate cyclase